MEKTKHHTVTVYSKRDYLYLRWRYQGKQVQLSCLLPDTPINRSIAESRAKVIEIDIATNAYDETLTKYRPSKSPANYVPASELSPDLISKQSKVKDLISYWLESNKSTWKLNTYLKHHALIRIAINASKELEKTLTNFSLSTFSNDLSQKTKQPKEVVKTLSTSLNWLIAHDLAESNPFSKLVKILPKAEWEVNPRANAFTPENKSKLIEYFGSNFPKYKPFVEFLFLTGCRPSEAVGLEWSQITFNDNSVVITFDRSISYRNGIPIFNKGSKNNKSRQFPCNKELSELLSLLYQSRTDDGLVFGNGSKPFSYPNFVKRQWKQSCSALCLEHTPYNCRDTFLTEQIVAGKPLAIICLWCDTSIAMLQKHYLDKQSAMELLPD